MANMDDNVVIDLTSDTENASPIINNVKRSADDAVLALATNKKKSKKTRNRLSSIYIVCKCNDPIQNDKWMEHSGHETEDTEMVAVYANLKDANRRARQEQNYLDDDSEEEDDDDHDDNSSLFYWQDDDPVEWTARRVWVEEKKIQY